jgi:hypothetical protein
MLSIIAADPRAIQKWNVEIKFEGSDMSISRNAHKEQKVEFYFGFGRNPSSFPGSARFLNGHFGPWVFTLHRPCHPHAVSW